MTEYPIGRQVANMNERDISKMTESQLGKVNWDTDAFEKFTGFENRMYDGKSIIHVDDVETILKKEFDDVPPIIGRDTFFNILGRKYIGISRRRVALFLKMDPENQMGQRRIKKSMAKSIITKRPYERIQIDTIDSSKLGKYPFTLTVIDTFSKYFWAEPLRNHTAAATSVAFGKISKRMLKPPKLVQSDNGTEFADLAKEYPDMKFIKSSPNLPQANGMIERVHGFIKSYIHSYQKKEKRGYTDQLDRVALLYNNRKHTITNHAPIDLNKLDLSTEIKESVLKRIKKSAGKHNPHDGVFSKLAKDDFVRIAILKKSPLDKQYQRWSSDVYQINKARKNDTYKLRGAGNVVLKYIYQRDYLLQIPDASGKKILKEQSERSAKEKKEAEEKRLREEVIRQEKYESKLLNDAEKPPSPSFKFKKGNKLSFPKEFFEKYDGDSSDVPQKRSGIITSTKEKGLKYYVRFIDADYANIEKRKQKSWAYELAEVEKFATEL